MRSRSATSKVTWISSPMQLTSGPRRYDTGPTARSVRQQRYRYSRVATEQHGTRDRGRPEPATQVVERRVECRQRLTVERKRKLDDAVVVEVRQGQADQGDPLTGDGGKRVDEQRPRGKEYVGRLCRWLGQRVRARGPREVCEAQPQDDGAADPPGSPQSSGEAVDEGDDGRVEEFGGPRGASEGPLRPDRATTTTHLDRAWIAVVGQGVKVPAGRRAEHRDQGPFGELGDFADGRDSLVSQLPGRHRPDTPEPLDR